MTSDLRLPHAPLGEAADDPANSRTGAGDALPLRSVVRQFHLWLGLTLGGLFALISLTGSALVFYVEIDAALHPQVQVPASPHAPAPNPRALDRALQTGRGRWHDPAGKWSFEVHGAHGTIPARYYPSAEHGHHARRMMVWFSADGARVLRAEPWGGYLMTWLYELHMHLLAGETGRAVVGWSGVAMLLLLVSGIAVWWPRGSWRKALAFKRGAAPLRRVRDLHKLFGLWSAALLFVLVATGVLLALPQVKTQLLAWTVAAPDPLPSPTSLPSGRAQVSVSQAIAAAHRALPAGRLAFVDVPARGPDPIRVRMQVPGDPHARFPSSFVFVDSHSGTVLAVHDTRRSNAGTTAAKWIRVLHDGSVGGTATRILAIVLGLVPTFLFVTGLIHWRRRTAARSRFSKRSE
ncbi:PepSY-associated TM helix domain-containing protein [Sphingomonas xinjiangensis]|uniref:Putative iron-regulated membrane protein n=1 Tax=Sphingomonas xinjiangensis TaxID=643568 RepID=A0A840YKY7_9SPHN|nr:PepSY-associated TM helix domain-containing protein [Sphingomonas xinjiangensis]MBB5709810.1 putative iron-regulated membrane protein [Sphingomonas xinjiangensis]